MGVIKMYKSSSADAISLAYREAIVSQTVRQRVARTAPDMIDHFANFELYFGHYHYPSDITTLHGIITYMTESYAGPDFRSGDPVCAEDCKEFFNGILHPLTTQRFTLQQASQHPWIASRPPHRMWDDYGVVGLPEPAPQSEPAA